MGEIANPFMLRLSTSTHVMYMCMDNYRFIHYLIPLSVECELPGVYEGG